MTICCWVEGIDDGDARFCEDPPVVGSPIALCRRHLDALTPLAGTVADDDEFWTDRDAQPRTADDV